MSDEDEAVVDPTPAPDSEAPSDDTPASTSTSRRRGRRQRAGVLVTAGISFLTAVVDLRDDRAFDQVSDSDFIEDELPSYEFIQQHLTSYGSLPSRGTCQENGIGLAGELEETSRYYFDRLTKRSVKRAVEERLDGFREAVSGDDPDAIEAVLHDMLDSVTRVNASNQYSTLSQETLNLAEKYREAKRNPAGIRGVPFGYPTLDMVTGGAKAADLITLVARTGVGKSWKLVKMVDAAHVAGHTPLIVSMEMSIEQLVARQVGVRSGLNPRAFKTGELCHWSEETFMQTLDDISGGKPMHFLSGDGNRTSEDVEKGIRQFNPDIVYVDAAYLLKLRNGKRVQAKWEKISEVMQELKGLAMTYNIPIVMTVQFNREVRHNTRKGKGGEGMDVGSIAGSDEIAQLSSLIIGLQMGDEGVERLHKRAYILKNRDGEVAEYDYHTIFDPVVDLSEFSPEDYQTMESYRRDLENADESTGGVADQAYQTA